MVVNLPDTDDATDDDTQLNISGGNLVIDSRNGEHADDTIAVGSITRLTVNGRAGDDTLTLDSSLSSFTGAIVVDGGAGGDKFSVGSTETANNGTLNADPVHADASSAARTPPPSRTACT